MNNNGSGLEVDVVGEHDGDLAAWAGDALEHPIRHLSKRPAQLKRLDISLRVDLHPGCPTPWRSLKAGGKDSLVPEAGKHLLKHPHKARRRSRGRSKAARQPQGRKPVW